MKYHTILNMCDNINLCKVRNYGEILHGKHEYLISRPKISYPTPLSLCKTNNITNNTKYSIYSEELELSSDKYLNNKLFRSNEFNSSKKEKQYANYIVNRK